MDVWVGVVIAGVVGFGLGLLVMWWTDRKRSGGSSVATLKKEHEQFRDQVTDHFVETAERINRLTDSYKDLFDHLSQGAETLVDESSLRERMPQVSDQEVRLKRLGTRTAVTENEGPAEAKGDSKKEPNENARPSSDAGASTGSSSGGSNRSTKGPGASQDASPAQGSSAARKESASSTPSQTTPAESTSTPSEPSNKVTPASTDPTAKAEAKKADAGPRSSMQPEKKPSSGESEASGKNSKP